MSSRAATRMVCFPPSSLRIESFVFQVYSLDLSSQRQQRQSMKASRENMAASPAFMRLLSQDPSLMVTPYRLQTLVSSAPPNMASTVTVTPARLAPASPTKGSPARLEPRVSLDPLHMAAPCLPPTPVSFIPLSPAFMGREMPGLAVPAFLILS